MHGLQPEGGRVPPLRGDQLLAREDERLSSRAWLRTGEGPLLQAIGEDPQARAVPEEELRERPAVIAEGEEVTGERVGFNHAASHGGEPVEALPHVDGSCRDVNAEARAGREHYSPSRTATRRAKAGASKLDGTRRR